MKERLATCDDEDISGRARVTKNGNSDFNLSHAS